MSKIAPVTRTVYLNGNEYKEVLICYKGKYIPEADVPKRVPRKTRGASKFKVNKDFFKSIAHKIPTAELAKLLGSIAFV